MFRGIIYKIYCRKILDYLQFTLFTGAAVMGAAMLSEKVGTENRWPKMCVRGSETQLL